MQIKRMIPKKIYSCLVAIAISSNFEVYAVLESLSRAIYLLVCHLHKQVICILYMSHKTDRRTNRNNIHITDSVLSQVMDGHSFQLIQNDDMY